MGNKAKPRFERYTDERCYISEILNHPANPEVSIARCRVEPGITTQLHSLSVSEWYVIESGTGRVHVAGQPEQNVHSGDTVTIPRNTAQQITNNGKKDLVFTCVCAPRYWPDCYTSLE